MYFFTYCLTAFLQTTGIHDYIWGKCDLIAYFRYGLDSFGYTPTFHCVADSRCAKMYYIRQLSIQDENSNILAEGSINETRINYTFPKTNHFNDSTYLCYLLYQDRYVYKVVKANLTKPMKMMDIIRVTVENGLSIVYFKDPNDYSNLQDIPGLLEHYEVICEGNNSIVTMREYTKYTLYYFELTDLDKNVAYVCRLSAISIKVRSYPVYFTVDPIASYSDEVNRNEESSIISPKKIERYLKALVYSPEDIMSFGTNVMLIGGIILIVIVVTYFIILKKKRE